MGTREASRGPCCFGSGSVFCAIKPNSVPETQKAGEKRQLVKAYIPGLFSRISQMHGFQPGIYGFTYQLRGYWGRMDDVTLYTN